MQWKIHIKYLRLTCFPFTLPVLYGVNNGSTFPHQQHFETTQVSALYFVVGINSEESKLLSAPAVAVPGTFSRNWNLGLAEANLGKLRLSVSSRELSRDGKTRTGKYLNYFTNWLCRIKMRRMRRTMKMEKTQENIKRKIGWWQLWKNITLKQLRINWIMKHGSARRTKRNCIECTRSCQWKNFPRFYKFNWDFTKLLAATLLLL